MALSKLKVDMDPDGSGPAHRRTRVFWNGVDISRFLTSLEVLYTSSDLTRAILYISVDDLEIDSEVIAELKAEIGKREEAGNAAKREVPNL